jgi:hypothetical protein
MLVDAPWYVLNTLIRRVLQIPSVKEEIIHYISDYRAHFTADPKDILLTRTHAAATAPDNDLSTRFVV